MIFINHMDKSLCKCPHCKCLTVDLRFCSNCGALLLPTGKRYHLIPDYPFRTNGPKQTHWSWSQKNIWASSDLSISGPENIGNSKLILWTPPVRLFSGVYDIFIISEEENPTITGYKLHIKSDGFESNYETHLFTRSVTINVIDHWLHLWIGVEDTNKGISIKTGQEIQYKIGILILPRFGYIWFGDELPHSEIKSNGDKKEYGHQSSDHSWSVQSTNFRDDFLTFGPYIPLSPGDYVAHVRLSIANWVEEDNPIISIDIFSSFKDTPPKFGTEKIAKIDVYPEDIHQPGKAQDFACYFHLDTLVFEDKEPDSHRNIECRIRTLNPADVTIHHIRLSTPDDLINEKYFELGGVYSVLGPPLGHTFVAASSKEGTRGYLKRYHAGSIYWSPQDGALETYGCIGYLYEKFGGTSGEPPDLGFPISDIRKVKSYYSNEAYVQYFEGYRNNRSAAIYSTSISNIECHEETFEVYGHIAFIYFRELGGHEGLLGFPMSGEHWASEEKRIRRNYFEGGYIDAVEVEPGRWDKHQVTFYPRPILKKPHIPDFIYNGDPHTIRIEVANFGGDAHESYITLSFPDSNVENITLNSDCGRGLISFKGEEVHWKYGSGDRIVVEYPRVELIIAPFKSADIYWMEVTFSPTKVGLLRFYLRCTAGMIPKYEKLNIHFEGDPSPVGSEPVDQQGEHVYEYSIDVVEKPYADLRIIDIVAQPLVRKSWGFITLVLQNVGTGIAKDITIILDDLLRSRGNLKIKSIDPGEQHPIIINVSPNDPGVVDLQFSLTYIDQFDTSHNFDLNRRYIIHENADQVFRFETLDIGLPEDLFTQIGNAFMECDQFQSDRSLRAIFVINELSPFRSELMEAPNLKARIAGLISFLFPKRAMNGENALAIFCRVLGKRYEENDQRRHNLIRLAGELSDYLSNNQP